jgi:hypothetical protein
MKKILFLSALLFGLSYTTRAQLSRYTFDGDMNMKMSLRYGKLSNTKIETEKVGGLAFRFYDLGKSSYTGSPWQYSGRWATLPETFSWVVFDVLFRQEFKWFSYQPNVTLIGDFIFGWHNFAYAVHRTDDLQVAIGVNGHDYFFAHQPDNRSDITDPAGWYIGGGPALIVDYNLLNTVVLHLEGTYTLATKIRDLPDMIVIPDYPDPHFINLLLEVRPQSRWYMGIEHVRSYNRGSTPGDGTRTDIHLGLKLFVDE